MAKRLCFTGAVLLAALSSSLSAAGAQERVLRFQHILPEASPQHQLLYLPWAKRISDASKGRLRIEVLSGAKLVGKPAELITQVETQKVDIGWVIAGYTPGRFPRLEVFELPWITSSRAAPTSQALYEFHHEYAREETASVHILAVWSHPSGVIMNRTTPILRPADAAGRSVRVPTVVMGEVFSSVGAKTFMSTATQVMKLLQDGAVDGSLFPYELIPTLKLGSHIRHISEFAGHRGFYTSVFFLAMNKSSYASLDAGLRKVLDDNSGPSLSSDLGRAWDAIEEAGRDAFTLAGGEVTFVRGEDYEDWVKASEPAIESWKARVGRIGIDGDKLIAAARGLVSKYTARAHND